MQTRMLTADVSLGVGVVAIGIATVLFLTNGPSEPQAVTARR